MRILAFRIRQDVWYICTRFTKTSYWGHISPIIISINFRFIKMVESVFVILSCGSLLMHQSIPAAPSPLPTATAGHLPALLIKQEFIHSENGSCRCESTFFGYKTKFRLILFEEHPFIFIKLFVHITLQRSCRCESTFFGYWTKFLLILFEEHPFIFIQLFVTYNVTALY